MDAPKPCDGCCDGWDDEGDWLPNMLGVVVVESGREEGGRDARVGGLYICVGGCGKGPRVSNVEMGPPLLTRWHIGWRFGGSNMNFRNKKDSPRQSRDRRVRHAKSTMHA